MKSIFVLLIIILMIVILYGYYNFSYNISNFLTIKEGIDDAPIYVLPNIQSAIGTTLNISTEKNFLIFMQKVYEDLYNNKLEINDDYDSKIKQTNSLIQKNIISIVNIVYEYSNIFNTVDYNTINYKYTNIMNNEYDRQSVNELFLSVKVFQNLHVNSDNLNKNEFTKILLNNWCFYNSLLGYLNKFTNSIIYFNKKVIPNKDILTVEGDDSTTKYYNNNQKQYPDSLVLYYPFYEDIYNYASGSFIIDAENHNCSDPISNLVLDGNSYITLPTINITDKGLTITCWFNFSYYNYPNTRIFNFGSTIEYMPRSAVLISGKSYDMSDLDDNWHHFALTISISNYEIYIDGGDTFNYVPTSSSNIENLTLGKITPNYIGKSNNEAYQNAIGSIRDFRVYNRVLNYNEIMKIKNLYNNINFYKDANGKINTGI